MAGDMILFSPPYKMTEIVFKDSAGNLPQSELVDQLSAFGGYSIGVFKNGGTGFIIRDLQDSPVKPALILTSAHIFMEYFEYKSDPINFYIEYDAYFATPLKKKIKWNKKKSF
jgi:hypothetical protein